MAGDLVDQVIERAPEVMDTVAEEKSPLNEIARAIEIDG